MAGARLPGGRGRINACAWANATSIPTSSSRAGSRTRPRTLTNPELIVEVLSSSTTERDLEDKLLAYTELDSLREYWVVSSARPLVMRYVLRGQEWVLRAALGLESTVQSEHFGVELPMSDLYVLVFDEA